MIIDVEKLNKYFGDKHVVKDFSMQVKQGEIFGFLGPNGSGKTTTIRMLCGLLTPDSGHGTCLGLDIVKQAYAIKKQVGYMTQRFSYYEDLSIEENLNFIARVYELSQRRKRVDQAIEQLGLTHRKGQLAGDLSGGWKQRVALAASMLHQPQLLLLDEPTAGVDPIARRQFWDQIHQLSEQGITSLVSTHYMDEAEQCSQLAYIAYGSLLISGTVKQVIDKTNITTWQITGNVSINLLQNLKKDKRIEQVALFGNKIHISGQNTQAIEQAINERIPDQLKVAIIEPTLEDAFISLVSQSEDNYR